MNTTSRATADVGLLERPAVESEEPEVVVAAAPASITTSKAKESSIPTPVAPLAPRTERRSVTNAGQKASVQSPVPEHPDVPGLLLQPDGFYWKKEWGDYK
jgi:hypothetical protein